MTGLSMMKVGLIAAIGAMGLSSATIPAATTNAAPLMVIAEVIAKPADVDAIRATMKTVAANALKKNGCLAYTLYEDQARPGRFLTYETWTGDAALTAHLTSPAMKAGTAKLMAQLAQAPTITKLKTP